jgi:acyl carrier protein
MTIFQNPVADAIALHIADQTGCDAIDYSLDLIESGLLDSMLIMGLLAFIGAEFGVVAKPQDISPARFRTVNSLTSWIVEKQLLAGAA